jgi:hypothetical protein
MKKEYCHVNIVDQPSGGTLRWIQYSSAPAAGLPSGNSTWPRSVTAFAGSAGGAVLVGSAAGRIGQKPVIVQATSGNNVQIR